jgi:hypothetical protein
MSAEIVLDKATIGPRLLVPYTLWSPSLALPSLDGGGHHGKGHAVPGVICKRGGLDDSDTDREMELASQVYTRDVERIK